MIALLADSSLTSSSVYNPDNRDYSASRSRLNTFGEALAAGAWVASESDSSPWIQALLDSPSFVNKIATQGRQDFEHWTETYKLAYGLTVYSFVYILDDSTGSERTFEGNSDRTSVVEHEFEAVLASYIRLFPITWNAAVAAIRWEVYGCDSGYAICPPITNANTVVNSRDVMVGAQVRVECVSGFVLQGVSSGASSLDVECGVYGEWNEDVSQLSCQYGKSFNVFYHCS